MPVDVNAEDRKFTAIQFCFCFLLTRKRTRLQLIILFSRFFMRIFLDESDQTFAG